VEQRLHDAQKRNLGWGRGAGIGGMQTPSPRALAMMSGGLKAIRSRAMKPAKLS
jgi:hypothetical protein